MSAPSAPVVDPRVDLLPPFRTVPLDVGLWRRHLAKAAAENITLLSVSAPFGAGRWLARVQGSAGARYVVRVRLAGAAASDVEASCSCPAGQRGQYWCKHSAVTLEHLSLLPSRSAALWEEVALVLSGKPF